MEADDFQAATEAFLAFLSDAGIRINPKIRIEDFRSEGRGRGVGELSLLSSDPLRYPIFRSGECNAHLVVVNALVLYLESHQQYDDPSTPY